MKKSSYIILFIVVILTGFNSGIGFGNAVGYMPGFEDTPAPHALSYWQHADSYFRARMPFFGNAILLSLIVSLIFLRKQWKTIGYWLLGAAFLLSVGELVIILTQNLPLNIIMQEFDPNHFDHVHFEMIRKQAVKIYYLRSIITITIFALSVTSAFMLLKPKAAIQQA